LFKASSAERVIGTLRFEPLIRVLAIVLMGGLCAAAATAHDVSELDRTFLENLSGFQPFPHLYLGAKHMVTGYDHLLYLAGVIFFLSRKSEIVLYVSLFALGHSFTLIAGVLMEVRVNASLVDAVIGFSVVYKAFENLGGFRALGGPWINTRLAVLGFGLIHGLGLATKLQDLAVDTEGLLGNLLLFNIGVELGQLAALFCLYLLLRAARQSESPGARIWPNILLMSAGFLIMGIHLYDFAAQNVGA